MPKPYHVLIIWLVMVSALTGIVYLLSGGNPGAISPIGKAGFIIACFICLHIANELVYD